MNSIYLNTINQRFFVVVVVAVKTSCKHAKLITLKKVLWTVLTFNAKSIAKVIPGRATMQQVTGKNPIHS